MKTGKTINSILAARVRVEQAEEDLVAATRRAEQAERERDAWERAAYEQLARAEKAEQELAAKRLLNCLRGIPTRTSDGF